MRPQPSTPKPQLDAVGSGAHAQLQKCRGLGRRHHSPVNLRITGKYKALGSRLRAFIHSVKRFGK